MRGRVFPLPPSSFSAPGLLPYRPCPGKICAPSEPQNPHDQKAARPVTKIIVFDLDGTLVDSAPGIHNSVNLALADMDRAPLSLKQVISFIGNGVPVLIDRVLTASDLARDLHGDLLAAFDRHYHTDPSYLTHPFCGVPRCLADLRDAGYRLGICTNKPEDPARQILDSLALAEFFDVVVGGDTTDHRKPHPHLLHTAFRQIGGEGTFVGDSEIDAECAHRAGVPFFLFTEGYRKLPVEGLAPAGVFSRYSDLAPLLRDRARTERPDPESRPML